MYIKRYLEDVVIKLHKTFKVLYLSGPRQVGKTTLLKLLATKFKMNYVTLDDLNDRKLAQEDPQLFLQQNPAPLMIDEAQYAPQLFPYIKMRVDAANKNGQYWLTGSQQFAMMRHVQESLAGRVGILSLLGLSLGEIKKSPKGSHAFLPTPTSRLGVVGIRQNVREIFKIILRGSFPVLYGPQAPELDFFYNSYLQTYINRDLRELFGVAKILQFQTFFQQCAARTGQILNYSDLARDSQISVHAAQEWISILENTRQIYLLRPYFNNRLKRLIKSPKLYFLDTGLAAYLTQWRTVDTLLHGAMAGAFFETFVVSEIVKSYLFHGQEPRMYYLRDRGGREIDLIMEDKARIYPVEIKMAAAVKQHDLSGIHYLQKSLKNVGNGAVIGLPQKPYALDRKNYFFPVTLIH